MITRHFLTIAASVDKPARRVHYRKCGQGPVLLLVHQSPRSSKEYEALMRAWGQHFTCIAPDSPGFGQSCPLGGEPDIADFARGLHQFLDKLGVKHCHAYGFHSGGIILAHALKQQPLRFTALAIGGYPSWTADEMAMFGARYALPFQPSAYGEHLAWLWNRVLEQSWFFPWFDLRDETRMRVAHADLARVQAIVMEMLDAGDAYRFGYNAALQAAPWTPPVDASTAPVLISAYTGDPLQAHIDRLPPLPAMWRTSRAANPAAHEADCLAFLLVHRGEDCPALAEDTGEGFVQVNDGLLHWKGTPGTAEMVLHAPGAELAEPGPDQIAVDVPGHGLSDAADDLMTTLEAARIALGAGRMVLPPVPAGDVNLLYPDLAPQRFGEHLARAWGIARAEALFRPWYAAQADAAIPVSQPAITPQAIALRTRARLRAGPTALMWHDALVKAQA
jgi:haloalkane dehalogenase